MPEYLFIVFDLDQPSSSIWTTSPQRAIDAVKTHKGGGVRFFGNGQDLNEKNTRRVLDAGDTINVYSGENCILTILKCKGL